MAVIGDGLWVYVFAFAARVGGLDKSALEIKLENLTMNATMQTPCCITIVTWLQVVFSKASFVQPKENKVALVAGRTVKKSTNFKYDGVALTS
jgi:hypothetical protein